MSRDMHVSHLPEAEQAPALVRYYRPADRSRPQRWCDAVAELLALQAEYITWCDALPDSPRDSANAEVLQPRTSETGVANPGPST